MSSLGGLATSAIFMLIVIISLGSMVGVTLLSYSLFKSYVLVLEDEGELAEGSLEVLSTSISADNRSLESLILNDGAGGIRVADFDKIDVILIYGGGEARWLPYDPSGSLPAGWKPLNITYGGSEELINPVSDDFSSGIWDSGEVLAIRAWINSSIEPPLKLIIVSPRGVGG